MKIGKHYLTLQWGDIVVCKNKSFEYQIELGEKARNLFSAKMFEFDFYKHNYDHKGFGMTFSLFKSIWIDLNIHDHRHWDRETNSFAESGK